MVSEDNDAQASKMESAKAISFGIPSLDRLIGGGESHGSGSDRSTAGYGYRLTNESDTNSKHAESATFCILGPDGTGKSLFALHLASEYFQSTCMDSEPPKIIYASTDLSFERATRVWKAFWLDRPASRSVRIPFEHEWRRPRDGERGMLSNEEIDEKFRNRESLVRLDPTSTSDAGNSIGRFLLDDSGSEGPVNRVGACAMRIAFLDLEAHTSGDDWDFLHKLLAVMKKPSSGSARHLLVIDAVEGLETLVGERDSFGQVQSRRARIAQIVRAATDKCHIVFVVEEPRDGERLPEVFVSDLVMRLRSVPDRDYARRTVEFEKVRGQRHIRGQHDFRIRQECSRTGEIPNVDDPEVGALLPDGSFEPMAYIHVFPSLHYLTRDNPPGNPRSRRKVVLSGDQRVAAEGSRTVSHCSAYKTKPYDWNYAWFGIYQLDVMLWNARRPEYRREGTDPRPCDLENLKRLQSYSIDDTGDVLDRHWEDIRCLDTCTLPKPIAGFDEMGLPIGSVTTLIGNDSTFKSQLALCFLSQCFRGRAALRTALPPRAQEQELTRLPVIWENRQDPIRGHGVAILLATNRSDLSSVQAKLRHSLIVDDSKLPGSEWTQEKGLKNMVLVRRLEPHHLPSAMIVHVVMSLVNEAKRLLHEHVRVVDEEPIKEIQLHGRIRFVIDDWSTILAMYPEVQRDPLVLPYLMSYLRREGVTTLIVATRSGNPQDRGFGELEQDIRELRAMADHHLHTWHVPFFGERRVAITVQPNPTPGNGLLIRELRPGRRSELPKNRLVDHVEAVGRSSKDETDEVGAIPKLPKNGTGTASTRAVHFDQEELDFDALVVDPHFELYSGLLEGHPCPVPLDVRLYAEREDLSSFSAYMDELRYLFQHLFGHEASHVSVGAECGPNYERLRSLSFLQSETQLDKTLVCQVDEFWADTRTELAPQERYLLARTVDWKNIPLRAEDPFGLFGWSQELRQRLAGQSPNFAGAIFPPLRRIDCLSTIGYDCETAVKRYPIEKVPYAWDFGFLVCNTAAWERASDESVRSVEVSSKGAIVVQVPVQDIWNRLWKIAIPGDSLAPDMRKFSAHVPDRTWQDYFDVRCHRLNAEFKEEETQKIYQKHLELPGVDLQKSVSWREFFGACKAVSRATKYEFVPFDLDLMAPESFSCLVLEVFFSEIFRACDIAINVFGQRTGGKSSPESPATDLEFVLRAKEHMDQVPGKKREDPYVRSFVEMFAKDTEAGQMHRRALYRTLLLIEQMVSRDQLRDQNLILETRPAERKSVASRHWYSTASLSLANSKEPFGRILVGLPGNFSVRGDWFLGVARGSRSLRLGERAIDILSSRRANIMRLQAGLGLPVRDLFPPVGLDGRSVEQRRDEFWTNLTFIAKDQTEHKIPYRELRHLGAWDEREMLGRSPAGGFQWLWRSRIRGYDAHCRIWQRWLVNILKHWHSWHGPQVASWRHPHTGDEVAPTQPADNSQSRFASDSFAEYDFADLCAFTPPINRLCFVHEHNNPRWTEFTSRCDGLIETLSRAPLTETSDGHSASC